MIELLASDYRPILQDILAYSICVAALIWGAGPERAMIVIWLFFFEFLAFFRDLFWGDALQLQSIDTYVTAIDLCAGLSWVAVALYANRNYPLFVAGLQILAIASHLARGLIDTIAPIAYAVMFIVPGWLQLFIIAAGLWRHARRERRFGAYREWRVPVPRLRWLSFRIKRT